MQAAQQETQAAYAIYRVDGTGLSVATGLLRATVKFEIRHIDGGPVAYSSSCQFIHCLSPKQIAGLRLACARQLPRYEAYLKKSGKRWEVEQKELREAEAAAKKNAQRIAYLQSRIPELQAELAQLLAS